MFIRKEKWKNGNGFTLVDFYSCDECYEEICESHPHYAKNDIHYCWKCSFIRGLIDEKKFLRSSGYAHSGYKARVHEGEIYIWEGNTPPWEMTNSDYRRTKEYREWRMAVLKRDAFTCQHCGVQENLQAHHIKAFAKYKKLRFKISNGITLCESCHRAEHKRIRSG
ncbi:HNH endonuclease [compost metagenome]